MPVLAHDPKYSGTSDKIDRRKRHRPKLSIAKLKLLKALLFPFYVLKSLWNLMSILGSIFSKLGLAAERASGALENASLLMLEQERARSKSFSNEGWAERKARYAAAAEIRAWEKSFTADENASPTGSGTVRIEGAIGSAPTSSPQFIAAEEKRDFILDESPSNFPPQACPSIRLVLFDLDGTLLRTDDLHGFRGRAHTGAQPLEYFDALTDAFHGNASRWIYRPRSISDLKEAFPDIKLGVFTRSPAGYAHHLLNLAYPNIAWDVVVAFEDVKRTKPYGDGILHAMRQTGVSDFESVALVGDNLSDIQAAYNAGCLAFLETSGWAKQVVPALEKIPDVKVKGAQSLLQAIRALPERLPALECAMFSQQAGRPRRFDAVPHEGLEGERVVVHVAGRLFVDSLELHTRRLFHRATHSILANKSSTHFPDSWIAVFVSFLQMQLSRHGFLVVTIIPAKPGRAPRLERLLAQLIAAAPEPVRKRCHFSSDLLVYRDNAVSHSKARLNRRDRMINARSNLFVCRPDLVVERDIVVFDDVVTSGATLLAANAKFRESGARTVTCVALAKSVRFS